MKSGWAGCNCFITACHLFRMVAVMDTICVTLLYKNVIMTGKSEMSLKRNRASIRHMGDIF